MGYVGTLLASTTLPGLRTFKMSECDANPRHLQVFIKRHASTIQEVEFDGLNARSQEEDAWQFLLTALSTLERVKYIHIRKPMALGRFVMLGPSDEIDWPSEHGSQSSDSADEYVFGLDGDHSDDNETPEESESNAAAPANDEAHYRKAALQWLADYVDSPPESPGDDDRQSKVFKKFVIEEVNKDCDCEHCPDIPLDEHDVYGTYMLEPRSNRMDWKIGLKLMMKYCLMAEDPDDDFSYDELERLGLAP